MESLTAPLQTLLSGVTAFLTAHPLVGSWYTAFVRFLFPVVAFLILFRAFRSLLKVPHTPEIWGQLSLPNGTPLQLTHWENIIGRGKTADVFLNYPSISRQHAALCRGEDGQWTVYDLGSKGGTAVNGEKVTDSAPVKLGDTITLGGVPLLFLPQTVAEREELEEKRRAERPVSSLPSFLGLTVFQVLACVQLVIACGAEEAPQIVLAFLGLTILMWLYFVALRCTRCVGFELETIAFFLSTLSLSVTASSAPGSLFKQFLAIFLGLGFFLVLGLFLRDLSRVQKIRWLMAAGAIGLLGITLVLGSAKYGAVNWISIGGLSFQPSEIAKLAVVIYFADSISKKKDLMRTFRYGIAPYAIILIAVAGLVGLEPHLSGAILIMGAGAVMMLVGGIHWVWVGGAIGAAATMMYTVLFVIGYNTSRITYWLDPWKDAQGKGYQLAQSLLTIGSGGLLGVGLGKSRQKFLYLPEEHNDFIFAIVCEELGLIGATVIMLLFAALILRGFWIALHARDRFGSLMVVGITTLVGLQTFLNIGVVTGLLPTTGISLPFFSYGGTALSIQLAEMGIVLSVSRQMKPTKAG